MAFKERMKINSKDIGPLRWQMLVEPSGWEETHEFLKWMKETYPECMCKRISANYFELRSSDMSIPLAIKMRWM